MTIIEKIKWKIRNKKENYPKCPWCGKRMKSGITVHGIWRTGYGDYKCDKCKTEVEIHWRHNKSREGHHIKWGPNFIEHAEAAGLKVVEK